MERRGESISLSFLGEIIPSKEYVLLFSFPSIAQIFAILSLLEEEVFLQAITQCLQLGFVGTLLSPLCFAHRS